LFEPLSRINRALGELRRRQVYRLAGIYVIGGWLILQVADVLLEIIDAPDGSLRMIALVLVLGFPLALVLAWVYDITPAGVVRTPRAEEAAPEPLHWNWRWLDYAIIVALLAILGFVLVRDVDIPDPGAASSIAVLPFADLSPAGDNRHFSDGLTEALMDSLARVPGLQVASRTSSFAFRDPGPAARDVASALHVGTLLEGSVRKAGNDLRISARLVDGRSGRHLWTETFDATMEDIFSVQETISRGIADALKIRLLGGETLVQVPTRDLAAYEEYLRGRDLLRREGTAEQLDQALVHFQNALELDAGFNLALAGICTAYWDQYVITRSADLAERAIDACREADVGPEARVETMVALGGLYRGTGQVDRSLAKFGRALEIEPNNADVHAGIGETLRVARDLEAAERHLRRAVELDPAYWRHHFALGRMLVDLGRLEEAADAVQRAIRLQPESAQPYFALGGIYYYQGEYLKAADAFRQSIGRNPNAIAYANAGTHYFYAGDYFQAEEMFRQASVMSPADFRWYGFLAEAIEMQGSSRQDEVVELYGTAIGLAYQALEINPRDHESRALVAAYLIQLGRLEQARDEIAHLEQIESLGRNALRGLAMAYLSLGDHDAAMRTFVSAVAEGFPAAMLHRDPRLKVLSGHPEFQALFEGAQSQR
jgi:TolB-like protein/tetratricopeptide (TPR) repeat protein